jgi:hypothetical protein
VSLLYGESYNSIPRGSKGVQLTSSGPRSGLQNWCCSVHANTEITLSGRYTVSVRLLARGVVVKEVFGVREAIDHRWHPRNWLE